jgi:hypothetical protein
LKGIGDAVKSIPSQVAGFAKDPTKGGFVADLAEVPLTALTLGVDEVPAVGRVATSVGGAAEAASVRVQVAAFNNPITSLVVGFGLGFNGVPVPEGFGGSMETGATAARGAKNLISMIKVFTGVP